MYYYIGLALNAFCIYHAYKNGKEYYWFFIILFLPGIGGLIYLFTQVSFAKTSVSISTEQAVNAIYPAKRVNNLEKQLEFLDTFENRIMLADAYAQNQRYEEARDMYLSALKGNYENDYYGVANLIKVYDALEEYDKVIAYTQKIINKVEFKQSEYQFLYAKALEKLGKTTKAEQELMKVNIPYKNYGERYYLAQFLIERSKITEAKEILEDILSESKHMQRKNYRKNSLVFSKVRELLNTL
ncbi:hypothetical protein NBRC110019_11420 [Neptunitalea chrysea]|uniref:Tetratricopeptide repeat protein n=1 Tax=Neptunitalea chrysea TaxID=1647581 RepID=A0A9W6EVX3_9FLAO|nr:hypothetical protein [Neptunitalea chrysea]GLB52103.1 hypothetical protein NBRC110019_11420 [Neptunitalea chrysea]